MSYYKTCPHCGAHLDPGERCDCKDEKKPPPGGDRESDKVKITVTIVSPGGRNVK